MPFVDPNSLLTKPYNLDQKCKCNSERYDLIVRGVNNKVLTTRDEIVL